MNSARPEEGLYDIVAGISVTEGIGFWVNSLKSGGPGRAPNLFLHQLLCAPVFFSLTYLSTAEAAGIEKGDFIATVQGKRPTSLGVQR